MIVIGQKGNDIMRKIPILFFIVLVLTLCGTGAAFAEEMTVTDSGSVTDTITWSLDSEGTLTLEGSGALPGFRSSIGNIEGEGLPPWKNYRGTIRKVGKTYYVRVRSFKKIKGKKYFGEWSKVRTVRVK